MKNSLGFEQALDLIGRLEEAVRDALARERELDEKRVETNKKLQEERRQAIAAAREALGTEIGRLEQELEQDLKQIAVRCKARQKRIARACRPTRLQMRRRIDEEEGSRKYALQKRMLAAEEQRKSALARLDADVESYDKRLGAAKDEFAGLPDLLWACFHGYLDPLQYIPAESDAAEVPGQTDHRACLDAVTAELDSVRNDLHGFGAQRLPKLMRLLPLPALLVLLVLGISPPFFRVFTRILGPSGSWITAVCAAVVFGSAIPLRVRAARKARKTAAAAARSYPIIGSMLLMCDELHAKWQRDEARRIEDDMAREEEVTGREWADATRSATKQRDSIGPLVEERARRCDARNERLHEARCRRREDEHNRAATHARIRIEERIRKCNAASQDKASKLAEASNHAWDELAERWHSTVTPVYSKVATANGEATDLAPPWEAGSWEDWEPPAAFPHSVKFGSVEVDVERLCGGLPSSKRLALTGPPRLDLPLHLTLPDQGSILLETWNNGKQEAIATLNNLVFRLLAAAPPGKLSFTFIDPVELGRNFAGIMPLVDYAETLVTGRIWTQPRQIEQRLADLNEHIEKVIQMYLRDEHRTIAEYNARAGGMAEPYRFLVVADFPVNFTDTAAQRLLSIATSGARCGVYTLIHWNRTRPPPVESVATELRQSSVCLACKGTRFDLSDRPEPALTVTLDPPPDRAVSAAMVRKIGDSSKDSNRVEIPFDRVAPPEPQLWSVDTVHGVRVPIGRAGAVKLQYLDIAAGMRQHALIAGKTGAGKSTLFHVLITNLSLWCSPEEVEFYLIDFKKGVEFKCYATERLPHARVVAIESDREFGLSVLQRVDRELRRRGDLFRAAGARDIEEYRDTHRKQPVPRTLLIIDEFQEFFVEDDRISQNAALLLDRLVRQGRAFGIHVLLGSQTLGGAYTLSRATLAQMAVRIALRCNEADAYLIMDDDNPAPRLLSRPGEAIYNDTGGRAEGNSPFQVAWLPLPERVTRLKRIRELADRSGVSYPGPIVFEGNMPADVTENRFLQKRLEEPPDKRAEEARLWLGAPNTIKGPTEAVFRTQSGDNLLIVGQQEEAAFAMVTIGVAALAAQFPPRAAHFIVLDDPRPGALHRQGLETLIAAAPHEAVLVRPRDVPRAIAGLAEEVARREGVADIGEEPTVFLCINGLQQYKPLRYEEDFGFSPKPGAAPSPGRQLDAIIRDGPAVGVHTVVICDTYNSVTRCLSRKALSEFTMRVLFQMSAGDSSNLIETPDAGRLGLYRALLYNDREGQTEIFRPYALPDRHWFKTTAAALRRRRPAGKKRSPAKPKRAKAARKSRTRGTDPRNSG